MIDIPCAANIAKPMINKMNNHADQLPAAYNEVSIKKSNASPGDAGNCKTNNKCDTYPEIYYFKLFHNYIFYNFRNI